MKAIVCQRSTTSKSPYLPAVIQLRKWLAHRQTDASDPTRTCASLVSPSAVFTQGGNTPVHTMHLRFRNLEHSCERTIQFEDQENRACCRHRK